MVTYRMWVPNRKGRVDLHFTSTNIKPGSVVHISVSEATALNTTSILVGHQTQTFRPNFGTASITVQNIAVREGAVDFYVFVDHSRPLNIVADITILDPPAQVIIGS
jgi:hypothetical protein